MATWDETAKVLVEDADADADWEGIWTLTYAAERATADLGVVAPMADAVELTYAALARAEALLSCDLNLADLACLTRTAAQLRSARGSAGTGDDVPLVRDRCTP